MTKYYPQWICQHVRTELDIQCLNTALIKTNTSTLASVEVQIAGFSLRVSKWMGEWKSLTWFVEGNFQHQELKQILNYHRIMNLKLLTVFEFSYFQCTFDESLHNKKLYWPQKQKACYSPVSH